MADSIYSNDVEKKSAAALNYTPSLSDGEISSPPGVWAELKQTFCTKEGWIGDYVRVSFCR
jgi:hypothetical protein